jgi:ABC-type multidrug transport system fused ATPase/permease subunit
MDIGSLVFLAGLMGVMADSIRSLSSFISFIQNGLVSGLRVFQLLDTPAEEERSTLKRPDLHAQVAVELDHVTFRYPDGLPVLNGFSARVGSGEVVALVGASGSGKTTVIKLLQDFYTAESGSIILFGSPLQELSRTDVRNLSAYVPQDSALFEGTIADNIALGRPGCSRAGIEEAAKKACIHDYILTLPQGYDTPVGERGNQVSGGQRQRIAIARALLKDAPLLLLDEATSALDSESEAQILQALQALKKGRTTIVVAHRLSTIQHADNILVIEKGVVVESGNHQTLFNKRGIYHELFLKGAAQDT